MSNFSILIPSWNNLPHLKLCVESIRQHSHFQNQIIVFVNDGSDGTLEWIKNQADIAYLHSPENVGICVSMNLARRLVTAPYIIYMNDDMYACPDWDLALSKAIEGIGHDDFYLSATLIEPHYSRNPNMVSVINHCGDRVDNFDEKKLLKSFPEMTRSNWSGASWPPSVVSTRLWDIVGGYSIQFSPGMYSDPDFSMKLWKYGIRLFIGIGNSMVYHFQSKSTGKVKMNKGADTFLMKWGISSKVFYRYYLRMGKDFAGPLPDHPEIPSWVLLGNTLKRIYKNILLVRP